MQLDYWKETAVHVFIMRQTGDEFWVVERVETQSQRYDGLEFSVTPKVLAFGIVTPGEKLGDFVVEGDGLATLEANSDDVGLELTVVEDNPGKKYRVEVKATDDIARGTVARSVTVHAEDGTSETSVQVRVFGRID